jgi:hypothetical protein
LVHDGFNEVKKKIRKKKIQVQKILRGIYFKKKRRLKYNTKEKWDEVTGGGKKSRGIK